MTYKRTGLLDRPEKAWSQHGGNTRVFAHEVTCWLVLFVYSVRLKSQRCSSHSRIRPNLSVFVTFNWPRMTSGKKYWSSSPDLLYVNVIDYYFQCHDGMAKVIDNFFKCILLACEIRIHNLFTLLICLILQCN